jgi:hypothetical protein
VAESRDESRGYRLDRGGIKGVGAGTNPTGILRGSTGCLKGLTEMAEGYRIWSDQISTSYGTQAGVPNGLPLANAPSVVHQKECSS